MSEMRMVHGRPHDARMADDHEVPVVIPYWFVRVLQALRRRQRDRRHARYRREELARRHAAASLYEPQAAASALVSKVAAAVLREREACAQLVQDVGYLDVAAMIRARGATW